MSRMYKALDVVSEQLHRASRSPHWNFATSPESNPPELHREHGQSRTQHVRLSALGLVQGMPLSASQSLAHLPFLHWLHLLVKPLDPCHFTAPATAPRAPATEIAAPATATGRTNQATEPATAVASAVPSPAGHSNLFPHNAQRNATKPVTRGWRATKLATARGDRTGDRTRHNPTARSRNK